jgi:hypothetical protein
LGVRFIFVRGKELSGVMTTGRRKLAMVGLAIAMLLTGLALATSAAGSDEPPATTANLEFVPTGSMNVIRNRLVAAPLPDGSVLVAGGEDMNPWSSAEIYDPATGSFSGLGLGALTEPLEEAVAAPLPDGRVLIAGGDSPPNGGFVKGAELFDPATRTFSDAGVGSLSNARGAPAAAALPNGDVLIVGGFDGRDLLPTAEVFDPKTLRFSSQGIGSMSIGRWGPIAAPLPDGKVLVAGGVTRAGISASAELFDPSTGQFSSAGLGQMTSPRAFAMAAPLLNGDVLIAGGIDSNDGDPIASAELFDPSTGQFSSNGVGPLSTGRMQAGAAPLPDGDVLIAGGSGANGELSTAEVFNVSAGTVPSASPAGMPPPSPTGSSPGLSSQLVLHIFRYERHRVRRAVAARAVRRRIIIATRYIPSSPIFTPTRASAILTRGRHVYATGSAGLARLVLNSRHGLAPGDYSLALRHRSGRHWLTAHVRLVLGS